MGGWILIAAELGEGCVIGTSELEGARGVELFEFGRGREWIMHEGVDC